MQAMSEHGGKKLWWTHFLLTPLCNFDTPMEASATRRYEPVRGWLVYFDLRSVYECHVVLAYKCALFCLLIDNIDIMLCIAHTYAR